MRSYFFIVGLAASSLIASSAQAHSRGFAWFFSHSRPSDTCSGQSAVATYYFSGRRTANGQAFDANGLYGSAPHDAFRITGNGDQP
jgi:rare lipoprotein A (peptidoglycan hydrolase)